MNYDLLSFLSKDNRPTYKKCKKWSELAGSSSEQFLIYTLGSEEAYGDKISTKLAARAFFFFFHNTAQYT